MHSSERLVLGVDGGGTKTVAWLASLDGDWQSAVVGRGIAGSGNPRAVGFEDAQASIATAIGAAFADAGISPQKAAAACLALAGAGRDEEQDRIRTWAEREHIAERIRVIGDAEPVLAAGASDNIGIAVISGTGSLAWGRNAAGQCARSGGWGYLLGDEGSGYAIALAGLQAAVRAADSRGPSTVLLDWLMEALGAAGAASLVEKVYHPTMNRPRLAELSEVVFQAADQHDQVAADIVHDAGTELAKMVASTARALGWSTGGFALAMAGGVLTSRSRLREELLQSLHKSGDGPAQVSIVHEPVRGALELARRMVT